MLDSLLFEPIQLVPLRVLNRISAPADWTTRYIRLVRLGLPELHQHCPRLLDDFRQ